MERKREKKVAHRFSCLITNLMFIFTLKVPQEKRMLILVLSFSP